MNEEIEKIFELVDQNKPADAVSLIKPILAKFADQPDCMYALGVIAHRQRDLIAAEQFVFRGIKSLWKNIVANEEFKKLISRYYYLYAAISFEAGKLARAASFMNLISERESFSGFDAVYQQINQQAYAVSTAVTKQILINDKKTENQIGKKSYDKLTEQLSEIMRYNSIELAERFLNKVQQLHQKYPKNPDVTHWCAITMIYKREYENALAYIDQAINLADWHPYYHNTKTIILKRLNRTNESKEVYEELLLKFPNYAEAHQNYANMIRDEGDYLWAEAFYKRALLLKPNYHECLMNIGLMYKEQEKPDEALQYLEASLKLRPNYATALLNMGIIYEEKKNRVKAVECYRKALQDNPYFYEIWLSMLHSEQHLFQWENIEKGTATIKEVINRNYRGELLPFNLISLAGITEEEQLKCTQIYAETKLAKIERKYFDYSKNKSNSKIRIGYLSADIRNHAVGNSIRELIARHDRNQFDVDIFSYGMNDQSETRKYFEHAFQGNFFDIVNFSHEESADLIYAKNIDILIDLTGYTSHCRPEILAYRPAPKQVAYLGYPSTMGTEHIQYMIADHEILPNSSDPYYAEKVVRMNACYFPIDKSLRFERETSRQREGIPEGKFVFCCFNQPYKINRQVMDAWAQIFARCTDAVLWVHSFTEESRINFLRLLEARGIARDRVYFANIKGELVDHIARIKNADLALDTFPYNGHTTTSDAVRVGVPVVCIKGNSFASRVSASMLKHAGLDELITQDAQSYVEVAVDLYNNRTKLTRLREKIESHDFQKNFLSCDILIPEFEHALIKIHND